MNIRNSAKFVSRFLAIPLSKTAARRQLWREVVSKQQPNMLSYQLMSYFSTNETPKAEEIIKTGEDWENKIMKSTKPVVLDFYADWCGPCKKLMPMIQEKYKKADGKWVFAKTNIDEFPELAEALGVRSVPHVFLIHNGEVKEQFLGAIPQPALDKFIEKAEELGKN